MFILRTVKEAGKAFEVNKNLGNEYTVVLESNQREQVDKMKSDGIITNDPIIYGYIVSESLEVLELSVQNRNYIMTENGKTFDNLSYKTNQ